MKTLLRLLLLLLPAAAVSCGNAVAPAPSGIAVDALQPLAMPGAGTRAFGRHTASPIAHVVFIIQENRSFDNLFQGYPGANTVSSGLDSTGQTVQLVPIPLQAPYDISHGSGDFLNATDNGKMDGFDLELTLGNAKKYAHPQYGYVPRSESKLYFDMAKQYVLGDNTFTSHLDASYIAHQYAIAAQADAAVNLPTYYGCDHSSENLIETLTQEREIGPNEATCRNYKTLGDELDGAGISWRYYTFSATGWLWEGYASVKHIRYGPDFKADIITPETRVLKDAQNGNLAAVSWVTPSIADSDHASSRSNTGPQWVASVVNAIGTSQYWNSTAIFVMWDEWGGWYDHVVPPYEDYDGLGIRVPLLVISPYAKRGYVTHTQYEMSSVLRFIEDNFGLAQLAASDARAADPAGDCFDFTRKPRPFTPFRTTLNGADFARMDAADPRGPDDQ